ncbi:MAG: TatD family hydrolase [Aigarchaeota archaeon]|nr:TatD family hydrolase [Aigarchaeota archaeon]MDW8092360.1 TatD family hydrolase [Nitrososphaerota archaeon]
MYIDVHAHLTHPLLYDRRDRVISVAKIMGVEKIITCGLGPSDSVRALEMIDGDVLVSLGIEPYNTAGYDEVLDLIYGNPGRIVAIGEVGLDLYRGDLGSLKDQEVVFRQFIEAARTLDKPLITHSRYAGRQVIEILLGSNLDRVNMHAYDGPIDLAKRASERGVMFSIPPRIVTSQQKKQLVKRLGLRSLMLETDAPFLGPTNSSLNEPMNVTYTVEWIARLTSVPTSKVVEVLYENTREFFGLR